MRQLQDQDPEERSTGSLDVEDVVRCVEVLERLLRDDETRTAWIVGFLVGSSVAGLSLPS
jgi:hypothetical protein